MVSTPVSDSKRRKGLSLQGSLQDALQHVRQDALGHAPSKADAHPAVPLPQPPSVTTPATSGPASAYDDLWQGVQSILQTALSPPSFQTWIRPLQVLHVDLSSPSTATVQVVASSDFTCGYVKNHYAPLLSEAFGSLLGVNEVTLQWEVQAPPTPNLVANAMEGPSETPPKRGASGGETEKKESLQPWTPRTMASGLQPRYTFEQFVIGPFNHFAHAAALAIAEQPGIAYNPFFIHGSVGLGKTHLIQAIGHYALRHHPNLTVRYVTTEMFTNDLIHALTTKKMNEFRDKYRKIDLLIMDDIQFLEGKEKTQEEIFHTFNALHGLSKQVIISSDRPPKALARLEERLVSRFEWGLIVDIQLPDLEARKAILRKKAEREGLTLRFHLDEEVLTYLAESAPHNIRELEGHFNKLAAVCMLEDKPFSMSTVNALFDHRPSHQRLDEALIFEVVHQLTGISVKELKGSSRCKDISHARHLAIYACRELLDISFPKLGKTLGRQHSTMLYSYEKLKEQMKHNTVLKKQVADLLEKCQHQCY